MSGCEVENPNPAAWTAVVAAALSLRDAANRASNGAQEDTLHTVHTHTH
jgi:hypothetical protein